MPDMLGAKKPRTYLVVFQNNANARHLGGMAGAVARIEVDNGKLSMTKQGDANTLGMFTDPVTSQPPGERRSLGEAVVSESTDVANIPHFPRNGEVYQALWKRTHGESVDGVISMDTPALAGLLEATGPLTVDGQRLDSGNAVDQLIHNAYLRLPPAQQDEFYADTSRALFDEIRAGRFSASGVRAGADQGRRAAAAHVLVGQREGTG